MGDVAIGNKTNLEIILLVIKEIKRMDLHGLTYDDSKHIERANKINTENIIEFPNNFSNCLEKSIEFHVQRY